MKRFKLIFLLSLTLLTILGTTSFAMVELTTEDAKQIIDYYKENLCGAFGYTNKNTTEAINASKEILNNTSASEFATFFNLNFNSKVREKYTGDYIFNNITIIGSTGTDTRRLSLYFILSNNTASSNLSYILISGEPPYIRDENGTFLIGVRMEILSNNQFYMYSTDIANSMLTNEEITFDSNDNILYYKPLLALSSYQVVYYENEQGYKKSYFLGNYIDLSPSIDIPSGDESGDTGGGTTTPSGDTGGGTTTPSGDTGGGTTTPDYSEDLDNINNQLGNIEDKIPTSGEIAEATEQGNKNFWGNKDEMNEEDYENQINEGINDSMEQITEELEQNEIFNSIAIAEQKIIDLFLEEPEDFKISWADVKYMNKTLVPKGEINFSQICRDNETLGNVKNILNIIVSAMISISLFKYIFNLIMVTLGIDHPLILETEKDDITEISSTRIGNKTYVTKRTYKSDKKGGR